MTASVPELEKRTSSAAGTIFEMRSATAYSRSVRECEDAADLHARARRLIHSGVGIAEDAGAVRQAVVDVLVAVDVGQARAFAGRRVDGAVFAPVAEIRRDPQRQAL